MRFMFPGKIQRFVRALRTAVATPRQPPGRRASMSFTTESLSGGDVADVLMARRKEFAATGQYPFLIAGQDELGRLNEVAACDERSVEEILEASTDVDVDRWIAEKRTQSAQDDFCEADVLGDWPETVSETGGSSLPADVLSGTNRPDVLLGLASLRHPWELPAVLKFGNWNACPAPEVHCAFFRRWHQEYGAQITSVSHDVIECQVSRPPVDREAALELAWQQYWYCCDIVDQGCGTVSDLAANLLESSSWSFWWD